jgi:hypothetical protein
MPGIIASARSLMEGVHGELGINTAAAPLGGPALPATIPATMTSTVPAAAPAGTVVHNHNEITLQVQGILDFRSKDTATRQLVEELRAYLVEIERSYS